MSKRLGITEQMYGRAVGMPAPRHPISFASHRKKIFCKACNTHFKHLEDEVIPILVPMARGLTMSLGPVSRELLSLWASKTGMALLAAHNLRDATPREHLDSVRYRGQPPTSSFVGYFRWGGGPNLIVGEENMHATGPDEPFRGNTYSAILTFRGLGFHFVGFLDPIPQGFMIGSTGHPVTFWPPTHGLIHWPPPYEPANAASIENLYRIAPVVPKPP
jgi:hypothetical protein